MRFEYSASTVDRWGMGGSCSLTHNLTTGKAEHPGDCDGEGPPPLPCCGGLRGQHAQALCEHRAIPHLFVISIEPDGADPGMVDIRAFAYYLAHQGAEGTLQALCLPSGAISQLGWYQLRPLSPAEAAPNPDAADGTRLKRCPEHGGAATSSQGAAQGSASAEEERTSTTLRLYAERQAAVQLDLRDLDRAIANLSQLDPTDPQRAELRVAQEALGSLRATLRGLGLSAQAAECGATP